MLQKLKDRNNCKTTTKNNELNSQMMTETEDGVKKKEDTVNPLFPGKNSTE